ncbi:hypothetical protein ANRL2_04350 [Anaerolineae bacterium]|nr:hypothetical protein ANRL2_04350 [Anaerolineae bacterium]
MNGRKNGRKAMDEKDSWRDVQILYERMEPAINKLARRLIRFDDTLDFDDLKQQAWMALKAAVAKYRKRKGGQMKLETYAYWYLQKHFQTAVDVDRVIYDIYDGNGNHVESLRGSEYTRRKKDMPPAHTVRSRRAFVDLTRKDSDGDWIEDVAADKAD